MSDVTYNTSTINQGFFYEIYNNGKQNGIYDYDDEILDKILYELITDLNLATKLFTPSSNDDNSKSYIYKWDVGSDKVITFGDLHGSFHTFLEV